MSFELTHFEQGKWYMQSEKIMDLWAQMFSSTQRVPFPSPGLGKEEPACPTGRGPTLFFTFPCNFLQGIFYAHASRLREFRGS